MSSHTSCGTVTFTLPLCLLKNGMLTTRSHNKNQGLNTNSLETKHSLNLYKRGISKRSQDLLRVTRKRCFQKTDLLLITTCSNAQRKPQGHSETSTTSVGRAEEDAGSGRFLCLGLLKIPAFNSCLFLYIYIYSFRLGGKCIHWFNATNDTMFLNMASKHLYWASGC